MLDLQGLWGLMGILAMIVLWGSGRKPRPSALEATALVGRTARSHSHVKKQACLQRKSSKAPKEGAKRPGMFGYGEGVHA